MRSPKTPFELNVHILAGLDRLQRGIATGAGCPWQDLAPEVVCGVAEFFRVGYRTHLVPDWIPALDGVAERLTAGARVADIGCGYGVSTILMTQAFPASTFHGFDYDPASIEAARAAAAAAGVAERVSFEVADAASIPALGYDLACTFDALHDYGDPLGAARRVRECLVPGGTWMIVEPRAGETVADNLNPVGRLYYAASTWLCVPNALSQGGPALGAQAGPAVLRDLLAEAGFADVRLAAETPFTIVLQARVGDAGHGTAGNRTGKPDVHDHRGRGA